MKVSIVGCGRVGSAAAFCLVARAVADEIVLVGSDRSRTAGDALDLLHASAFVGTNTVIAGEVADSADSDILVITASVAPEFTDTRSSAVAENARLFSDLIPRLATLSPRCVMVVVTNPLDVMTYVALRQSKLDWRRVIGTGTLVDTARFRALLGDAWNIHTNDVRAYMLGEHGDTQFPALSVASAGGVRFRADDPTVAAAAGGARLAGYEVVRQKGYTNYAIAMAVSMIVEAIAGDARTVLPLSVLVGGDGGFLSGVPEVCLSLPCVVGRGGVLRILPIDLNAAEIAQFRRSAAAVRAMIDSVEM
jgi:L-lactate dehydrogenase